MQKPIFKNTVKIFSLFFILAFCEFSFSDEINGTKGNDILVSSNNDDILTGEAGDDIYQFHMNWGSDRIKETRTEDGDINTIRFGTGISPKDLTLERDKSYGFVIKHKNGDQVVVSLFFQAYKGGQRIQKIAFDDGTLWDADDINQIMTTGDEADNKLYGDNGDDLLQGGPGNDVLRGDRGDDTYYFEPNWGNDVIKEARADEGGTNTIRFGKGISPEDLTLERDKSYGFVIKHKNGDQITVSLFFQAYKGGQRIQKIAFEDGTLWDADDINQIMTTGDEGDNKLYGDNGDDLLQGGPGNDILRGDRGDDTYYFELNWGSDIIKETRADEGGTNTIRFGKGISPKDLTLERDKSYGFIIKHKNGDQIVVSLFFQVHKGGQRIQKIAFEDGTLWNADDINQVMTTGDEGDNKLYGDNGDDFFQGGPGNDTLLGYSGDDTYYFDSNWGADTIINSDRADNGNKDSIKFSCSILPSDISLTRERSNLIVKHRGGDSINIKSYYHSWAGGDRIQEIVFDNGLIWDSNRIEDIINGKYSVSSSSKIEGEEGKILVNNCKNDSDKDGDGIANSQDPFPGDPKNAQSKEWVSCSSGWGTCYLKEPSLVRYGSKGKYIFKVVRDYIACNSLEFGASFDNSASNCDYLLGGPIDSLNIHNEWVVTLKDSLMLKGRSKNNRKDEIKKIAEKLINEVNSKAFSGSSNINSNEVVKIYAFSLKGFSAILSEDAADYLSKHADVKYIHPNKFIKIKPISKILELRKRSRLSSDNISEGDLQTNPPWGLDRIDQIANELDNKFSYQQTGEGVHVYIIDSGINLDHSEFSERIGDGYDFVDGDTSPEDCHGHGTHVAGTAGGYKYGVAKKTTLHPVKVLDCKGKSSFDRIIEGIDWISENHIKPAVVNMSIVTGGSDPYIFNPVDDAIKASIEKGVAYTISAGNVDIDSCKTSIARVEPAITVAATDRNDKRAIFENGASNFGACVDIFAPGKNIVSAGINSTQSTSTMSGTSMAAPHVAGVIALYLEKNPNYSPEEILEKLLNNAISGVVKDDKGSPNLLLSSIIDEEVLPAEIIYPSNNSKFISTTIAFKWNDTGASEYKLAVGSSKGSSNYYDGSLGRSTSQTVSDLPTDGSTVYARLSSLINGAWQHKDFSYTAYKIIANPAVITHPVNGSRLVSTSIPFKWNDVNATEYKLSVGAHKGGNNYYSSSLGTKTSQVVSGLPRDGSIVYARLSSLINGVWQYKDFSYTAYKVTTSPAVIFSPVNGSQLASTSVTFKWSHTGASQYKLAVGSRKGGSNYYSGSLGTKNSLALSNLPRNGSTVYVRLSSLINRVWQHKDFSYTAYKATVNPAVISYPANGSRLPSSSVSFKWSLTGASQYKLAVGSSKGSANYYSGSPGISSSQTVSGLPSNGSIVYARLSSLINGVWQHKDFSYTAYKVTVNPAVISYPANGSRLPSSSVSFKWSLTGASQYKLAVGSSKGSANYYSGSPGISSSQTVSGLPSNGSIVYARLSSLINGVWQHKDFSYTAYKVTTNPAVITYPTNGSQLKSTSVTFRWSNVGASEYLLFVGAAKGLSHYYNSSEGKNTSRTVTGLPSDGRTLYVRIGSIINGVYKYTDFTYTAHKVSAVPAAISYPVNRSRLTSSSVSFKWSHTGASEYKLAVGSSSGGSNYYSGSLGVKTSQTVSGLPRNGRTIYVRLSSLISGSWRHKDFTYTANDSEVVVTGYLQQARLHNQYQLELLYRGFFNRVPDKEGYCFWKKALDNGTSYESIAKEFYDGEEFSSKRRGQSRREFIKMLYRHMLKREADEEGLNFWNSSNRPPYLLIKDSFEGIRHKGDYDTIMSQLKNINMGSCY